jgi:hypothetical protein
MKNRWDEIRPKDALEKGVQNLSRNSLKLLDRFIIVPSNVYNKIKHLSGYESNKNG